MSDPRATLLEHLGVGTDLLSLLDRMDSTEIVLHANPEVAALALSTANLCARLFPNVRLVAEDSETKSLFGRGVLGDVANAVISAARVAQPRSPRRSVSIGIGVQNPGLDLYCSSSVWNLRLSREPHQCLGGLGPATSAASALTSAQIARDLLPEVHGLRLDGLYEWNLLDYTRGTIEKEPPPSKVDFLLFGAGSVGSSVVYALLLGRAVGSVVVVDPDRLVSRNRLRYPLWIDFKEREKVFWLREVSDMSDLKVSPVVSSAADYISGLESAPRLAVSSVDNVTARRDIVDALAEVTLDSGVEGLQFHVSRHRFGDGWACAFCEYVDASDILDQVGMYAKLTSLTRERIEALLHGALLSSEDVQSLEKNVGDEGSLDEYIGLRLQDLVRARHYAQAPSKVGDSVVAISAPYVSAFAGAILASEVQKSSPSLVEYALDRRIDIDCSGFPTGIVSRPKQDTSRRCLCSSAFRAAEYRASWGLSDP